MGLGFVVCVRVCVCVCVYAGGVEQNCGFWFVNWARIFFFCCENAQNGSDLGVRDLCAFKPTAL